MVNDTAVRSVKLIQDYNDSLTKDEEHKKYLLQGVAEYRKIYPEVKKSTLENL